MSYAKINMVQQLRRAARREPISTPLDVLAALVLAELTTKEDRSARRRDDSVRFLDRLYRLEDPRS